jgi:hypothetical protein
VSTAGGDTLMQQLVALFSAALTPLIAIVATYIAYQQYQTNRIRLRLDTYDRRLEMYASIKRILSVIVSATNASIEELLKFRSECAEADFLFGKKISQ